MPFVSAIRSCFASKDYIYNLTANWQQNRANFAALVALFDDKATLRSVTQFLLPIADRLHEYICPYFIANLLSKYVSRFCYIIFAFCQHNLMYQNLN